jgi:hypothetical protein
MRYSITLFSTNECADSPAHIEPYQTAYSETDQAPLVGGADLATDHQFGADSASYASAHCADHFSHA